MKRLQKNLRAASSRLGPLLLLFQRSPIVQMLFPEAKIIGGAGLGEITRWTVATVAGLGAYDSVSGATQITQVAPQPNSITVDTAVGASLTFLVQATGSAVVEPKSWSIEFDLPPGLTHNNSTNSTTDYISGVPTEMGEFPFRFTAWKEDFQTGESVSQDFTIIVGPAVITQHPASISISSGGTTTLNVAATGPGLSYQWFRKTSSTTQTAISGATLASFTTPALSTTTSYVVRVTRGTIVSFSDVATVTISANNTFADWRTSRFNATQLANAAISGPTANPDGDSADNNTEYIFGTLPLTRENPPLTIAMNGADVSLTFTARTATGGGYAGRTRHYALEKRTDLTSGTWTSPTGFSDIIGANQTVNYTAPRGSVPEFFRLRVWLTP